MRPSHGSRATLQDSAILYIKHTPVFFICQAYTLCHFYRYHRPLYNIYILIIIIVDYIKNKIYKKINI
nr:MAG TPA: hypothetical protein [Caudoviricetes sp.]